MTGPVAPPPGPHGGDGAALAARLGVATETVLDLSASLNPCASDVPALVAASAGSVRHYPDPSQATVTLANALDVDPDRVVLTNGGAEAIALLAAEHPTGWVDEPEFSLYARHLATLTPGAPRWASNPRTPTGRLAPAEERADVWDEAFYPLAAGTWSRGDADATVVGSLTKLFACPGLRVGYVLCTDADLAGRLRRRQPEWAVGSIACAVVPDLLAAADLPGWRDEIARNRAAVVARLSRAGVAPEPSDAPWVLVRDAPTLREHLARRGVLVRDTGSFGIAGGVRIAVPATDGVERLDAALEGWHV